MIAMFIQRKEARRAGWWGIKSLGFGFSMIIIAIVSGLLLKIPIDSTLLWAFIFGVGGISFGFFAGISAMFAFAGELYESGDEEEKRLAEEYRVQPSGRSFGYIRDKYWSRWKS